VASNVFRAKDSASAVVIEVPSSRRRWVGFTGSWAEMANKGAKAIQLNIVLHDTSETGNVLAKATHNRTVISLDCNAGIRRDRRTRVRQTCPMANRFQVQALDYGQFSGYFNMSDDELAGMHAARMTVSETPGTPCRVSLRDAEVGEEVILISFNHLATGSPYHAQGPIFVRKDAEPASLSGNELPAMLRSRILSVRAYNAAGFMTKATVEPGSEIDGVVDSFLDDPETAFIHIHFAKPGCFACSVVRT